MNALHNKYSKDGLVILGFPCNQFGNQEPGNEEEIKMYVASRNVEFQMMSKVDVNGPNACDTYRYLKSVTGEGDIKWNFHNYFVVSRFGDQIKSYNDLFFGVEAQIKSLLQTQSSEL
jgi:glutathione peroxidase